MPTLSKSKLLAYNQCPKRLWLSVHQPEALADSAGTQARFNAGHEIGAIAQQLYDPQGSGHVVNIDFGNGGIASALAESQQLIKDATGPVFELGIQAAGARAFADVMLPVATADGARQWRMVEVKSSTSVKDYHRDDAAIQSYVATQAGIPLHSIAIAHIDSSWVYPGEQNYQGLLVEQDLTQEAMSRHAEVAHWITGAQKTVAAAQEPAIATGLHCTAPFACGFLTHCSKGEPQAEQPVRWLPRLSTHAREGFQQEGILELRDVPDAQLNEMQRRVKTHTLAQTVFFDSQGAANDLRHHPLPGYFLDFETIQFAAPIWAGTRPYQQICFQYSLHTLTADGKLSSTAFLEDSGNDPGLPFARALIQNCGTSGPVFVYNAGFETARIKELAERFPELAQPLLAINHRVVDLLPIARNRYYNPSQQGSWSIKHVLPAIDSSLNYAQLTGVQNGGMAQEAYLRAIASTTTATDKATLRAQLLAYCKLDTLAMVRLWSFFSGTPVDLSEA